MDLFRIDFCLSFLLSVLCSASNAYSVDDSFETRAPAIDCSTAEKHHPHELYCDWYYVCIDDKPVATHCPSGLHFSPVFRMCVLPEFADCKVSKIDFDFFERN